MNTRRIRYLTMGALATLACATACSSSSSTDTINAPLGVRDEYEAQGALPAEGGITEITFYDDQVYSLKQTTGCSTGELLCHEHGTYVLDTDASTLTLTPSSGAKRVLPFTSTKVSSTTSLATAHLHPLGGVSLGGGGTGLTSGTDASLTSGDAGQLTSSITISLVLSFTINGQTFSADISLTIGSGGEAGANGDSGTTLGGDANDAVALTNPDATVSSSTGSSVTSSSSGSSLTNPLGDSGLTSGDAQTLTGGSSSGSGSSASSGSSSASSTSSGGTSSGGGTGSSGASGGSSGASSASSSSSSGSSGSASSSASSSSAASSSSSTASSASSSSVSSTGIAKGVDVSHYQGTPNWSQVHTADGFAYAKATEGTSYTDLSFGANWQAMKAAGITRGAYHFFRASKDPVQQADFFVNTIANKGGFNAGADLAPMVDVEVTDGQSAATVVTNLKKFIAEAESKLGGGVKLVIYTGPSFWISTLGNPNFSANPLWIAHYTSAAKPIVPSHWSNYTIWQYTDVVSTPGISGSGVDGDRWNGAQSAVQAFVGSDP